MAVCWVVLSGGGQHRVMDERTTVVKQIKNALNAPKPQAATVELPGLGTVFAAHVVAVREDER